MADQGITLVRSRDAEGTRFVGARLDTRGNLTVEGQDLGAGVTAFFGAGNTKFEWGLTVVAEDIPTVLRALGAPEETPILSELATRFSGVDAPRLRAFLEELGLAREVWSRLGE